jgi:hypothetical protein
MSEPRPLDAEKIDRLKARFERFREREAEADKQRRTSQRGSARGQARTQARDRDQGLGD